MNGGTGSKDPMLHCDPLGWPRSFTYNYGFEFIMLPDRVLQLFELGGYHRVIWTDGRKLPDDPPQPRWYGYAVGHWDGDTFVVESNGYEDRSWLDEDRPLKERGMPHSDEMKIVERWHRASYENIEIELTIIDPKVSTAPWVTKGKDTLRPGAELSELASVNTVMSAGLKKDSLKPGDEVKMSVYGSKSGTPESLIHYIQRADGTVVLGWSNQVAGNPIGREERLRNIPAGPAKGQ